MFSLNIARFPPVNNADGCVSTKCWIIHFQFLCRKAKNALLFVSEGLIILVFALE